MSWASLANNQCVSCNNLQDAVNNGIFVAKTTIPVSTKQITKTEADTYVYIDTSFPAYATKASNELIVKIDLLALPPISTSTWAGGFVSETGQYQIVINTTTGYLWESSNYGATWAQNTSAGSKSWQHISISSNGVYRVAVTSSDLFVSSNSGSSYSGFGLPTSWVGTAITDDGQTMYATIYGATPYRSTNFGGTFSPVSSLGSGAWQFPSISSNGQWVLVPDSNYIISMKRSGDYGVTWANAGPTSPDSFLSSAMSNSGQYQIAGLYGGVGAYISSNYGATFTLNSFGIGFVKYFASAAMSGSGEFMLIADNYSNGNPTDNGWVWRSTNFGSSFSKITALGQPIYWRGVGFGGTYALAVSSDHVNRSTDNGATWTQVL